MDDEQRVVEEKFGISNQEVGQHNRLKGCEVRVPESILALGRRHCEQISRREKVQQAANSRKV